MLEQLINLVTNHSQDDIIKNPAIPNEHNNTAIAETTNSILSSLQSTLANGGMKDIIGMFTGQQQLNSSNGLVSSISDNVVGSLMSKLGLENGIAKSIAMSLVPKVLGSLVSKTQDPNDNNFNLNGLIGLLTSGNASNQQATNGFDLQGMLGKVMTGGIDQNHDGKTGLDDIIGLVTNSASQNQSQYGGFGNLINQFIK